jgi:hypothetical protein
MCIQYVEIFGCAYMYMFTYYKIFNPEIRQNVATVLAICIQNVNIIVYIVLSKFNGYY